MGVPSLPACAAHCFAFPIRLAPVSSLKLNTCFLFGKLFLLPLISSIWTQTTFSCGSIRDRLPIRILPLSCNGPFLLLQPIAFMLILPF